MSDVKVLRLNSTEEIIGTVEHGDGVYKIRKPLRVAISKEGMQLIPWLLTRDEDFEINESCVTIVYTPFDEVVNGYKQQTGGIETASASALDKKGNLIF